MDFESFKIIDIFPKNPYLRIKLVIFTVAAFYLFHSSIFGFEKILEVDIFFGVLYQWVIFLAFIVFALGAFFLCRSLYEKYVKDYS